MMWRLMNWLDDRWFGVYARGEVRHDWHDRHPRLWAVGTVPLSTWLRQPGTGWQSYRRVIVLTLAERDHLRPAQ
jgi:hypothetical protein